MTPPTRWKGRPQSALHPWRRSLKEGKYGVAPKELRTYNGVIYHSKMEADYAKQLDLLMHAQGPGRVVRWYRQVAVALAINGHHICNYVVDFYVETADGRREYHEVKGATTPEARIKMRMFEVLYPEKKLLVVR